MLEKAENKYITVVYIAMNNFKVHMKEILVYIQIMGLLR